MAEITLSFDDGSFAMVEDTLQNYEGKNIIRFGPLTTTLTSLFKDGFFLIVYGQEQGNGDLPYYRKHKVYLERRETKERYVIAKVMLRDLISNRRLCDFVKPDVQMIGRGAGREITKFITADPVDPWDVLRARHPRKKKVIMIGNMTAREHVDAALTKRN